jgi:hypothetical protein
MLFVRRLVSVIALATVFFISLSAQAPEPSPRQPNPQQQQKSKPKCADNGTYVNGRGETAKLQAPARTCSLSSTRIPLPAYRTESRSVRSRCRLF